MKKETRQKNATHALCVALIVMILCSLVNWAVITGFGKTKITQMNLVSENGYQNTALLYVPETATVENPAPAIIMFHGISGNARNHESWAVEFSRRGFVVLSVDWYGNGGSDFNGQQITDTQWPALQQYIDYLKSMDNVNSDELVFGGHSMGTDPTYFLAARNNPKVALLCNLLSPGASKGIELYNGNLLLLSGTADKSSKDSNYWDRVASLFDALGVDYDKIETDRMYGSFEEGNAKLIIRQKDMIHEAAFISSECIGHLLDFSQDALGHDVIPNYMPGSQQIWFWKDVVGLLGMFSFLGFLLTLAVFLMNCVSCFDGLQQPMPRNIGLRGKGLAISIAAALLFPILVARFGGPLYKLANKCYASFGWFAGNYQNYAFAMVVGLNLLGLGFFTLFLLTDAKKEKANLRDLGLATDANPTKLTLKPIVIAFAIALITVSCGWGYLRLQGDVLGTDFYCLFFGFRPIPWNKFPSYIPYMLFWIPAFTIAALGLNVERRLPSTGNEKKDFVIAMVFNTFCSTAAVCFLVWVENYVQIHICGSETTALASWGIAVCRLWGMPVGMAMAGLGQTYLYRKSGSIWLGAFTMGMVCCLMACLYGQFRV